MKKTRFGESQIISILDVDWFEQNGRKVTNWYEAATCPQRAI